MKTIRLCPGCGAPLASDAPGGLCPPCLLKTQVIDDNDVTADTPRAVPVPGQPFGEYRIVKLLGHGGMGEVFEAEHAGTGRRVALKVMRHTLASEQDRKRFLREGRLAASVNHPHVVYIHGSEEIDGAPVIAMELVHGGTLKDRLKREGPLPIAGAVEAALQIIDGLEAAHAVGVLHRDIKPANCFVASDGTVKVGDFGLSVSTLARGESLITASGAVLGTPAYASPEQLRGEELDVTSDIYSVGATLYHLLTGKTPFAATDFVKLITEVLDKQPAAPKSLRAEIPGELSKVILRCLAKERSARFQSYTELRDAFLPFRAAEAVPARPAMRVLAGMLDEFIAYGPNWLFLIYWSMDPLDRLAHERTWLAALVWLPFFGWYVLYYTIAEGLWGAGVGKSICRLRVVGRDQQPPGLARAVLRVLIYSVPLTLPSFLLMALVPLAQVSLISQPSEWLTGREGSVFTDWAWLPLTVLLFITMRRRNGYAALHDLATGTRVIVRPQSQPRPALAFSPVPPRVAATGLPGYGPYATSEILWKNGDEELVQAFDPALQRKIWIHLRPHEVAPLDEARRDLSRPARLRWINRGQTEARVWDAYEAPEGAPFLTVTQRAQPWSAARFWLLDLAEEFSAALETQGARPRLDLARLWITKSGHALVLDFPAPGLANVPTSDEAGELGSQEGAERFLARVARLALEGPAASGTEPIRAPVPLHAQSFLSSLVRGTFEEVRFIVGNLRSLCAKPTEISRARRAVSLAFVPLLVAVLSVSIAGIVSFDRIRWDRAWTAAHPELPSMRSAAELYDYRKDLVELSAQHRQDFEAIGIYIASHYGELITNAQFWASPAGRLLQGSSEQDALEDALKRFANPTAEQAAEAERRVSKRLAEHEREQRFLGFQIAISLAVLIPAIAALVDLLGAAAFGLSPLLRLFGVTVVKRDGSAASRLRLCARLVVAWVPVVGGTLLVVGLGSYIAESTDAFARGSALAVIVATMAVLAGAAIYAVLRPAAGLQDRVAGTRLVMV